MMRDALSVEATRRANAEHRRRRCGARGGHRRRGRRVRARAPRAGWRQNPGASQPVAGVGAPPRRRGSCCGDAERRGGGGRAAGGEGVRASPSSTSARCGTCARACTGANAPPDVSRARGGVWRKGGGGPGPGRAPGGLTPKRRPPVRARAGVSYGRQLAGRAPNVGYANRAEAARGGWSRVYGPRARSSHNPHRPQDRPVPYLDPHSASARSRRASVNAGHQWATPRCGAPGASPRAAARRRWSRSTHRGEQSRGGAVERRNRLCAQRIRRR